MHKEKSGVYFTEKMVEVRVKNRIKVEIHQEKVGFINEACEKELRYSKRVALESVSTKNEAKELNELAAARVILVRKVKNERIVNIDEIIFYLKSQYLARTPKKELLFEIFRAKKTCLLLKK